MSDTGSRSIHYRRRWAYALWVVLLLAAAGALVAWRIPASRGEGHVSMILRVPKAPPGLKVEMWCGPASRWKAAKAAYALGQVVPQDGRVVLGPFPVAVARRRWMKVFHPDTADLVVLRFSAPDSASTYASYNLGPDLYSGFLAERRKMKLEVTLPWGALSANSASPSKIQ